MKFEERKMQLELESDHSGKEEREANQAEGTSVIFGGARSPDLPHFIDKKDDLDSYML